MDEGQRRTLVSMARWYGAFSVSPSRLNDVKKYIATQKEHHARETYQDEFRGFLRRYEIDHDEKYVWG
jgi:putative transposase